jgi:hypothetical protein
VAPQDEVSEYASVFRRMKQTVQVNDQRLVSRY